MGTKQRLDSINAQMSQLFGYVQSFVRQAQDSLLDLNLRQSVIESLLTDAEFQSIRDKIAAGGVPIDDLKKIADDKIIPDLKKQMEDMQQKMNEMQAAQQKPKSNIVGPDGSPAGIKTLVTPDGRRIPIDDSDDEDEPETEETEESNVVSFEK